MSEFETAPSAAGIVGAPPVEFVERERALAFSEALRALLQRQNFYVPLTETYLLPQFYERVRAIDGHGIHINTLRAYLRGEALPSDTKVRLLADALAIPRGVLLFASGYLTAEDLPNYPGSHASLASIEADMAEVEALPLASATKERILRDLRTSARILVLVHADRAQAGERTAPDERERLIEQLIEIWEVHAPPPPPLTSSEEAAVQVRSAAATLTATYTSPAAGSESVAPEQPLTATQVQPPVAQMLSRRQ